MLNFLNNEHKLTHNLQILKIRIFYLPYNSTINN